MEFLLPQWQKSGEFSKQLRGRAYRMLKYPSEKYFFYARTGGTVGVALFVEKRG